MSSGSCNGLCVRHPKRTKKRIQAVNFDITRDAVCRKCECYFKNISAVRCPCCHAKFSRRLTTMKTVKLRMHAIYQKLSSAFRDFWNMVHRTILKAKRERKLKPKKADLTERKCLLCNSSFTYINSNGSPEWRRYLHGYICSICHGRRS